MKKQKFVIYMPANEECGGFIVLRTLYKGLEQLGIDVKVITTFRTNATGKYKYIMPFYLFFYQIYYFFKNHRDEDYKSFKHKFFPFVDKNTIVVYPEIVNGNLLNAKNVVRWLLYHNKIYRKDENGNTIGYNKNDLFFALLVYVLVCGGQIVYILETGINGLGNMIQNFIGMATYTDPLRENSFPQNWTLYYWAYWMAWCVATPFFIATISKGRTIKNVIIGGYCCGLSGTYLSFIILGNFGLGQQMHNGSGLADVIYNADSSINYSAILDVFNGLPIPELGIIVLVISMIAFYATTFDTLTLVVSNYSYKKIGEKKNKVNF